MMLKLTSCTQGKTLATPPPHPSTQAGRLASWQVDTVVSHSCRSDSLEGMVGVGRKEKGRGVVCGC